jgi:hypothetical protein
MGPTCADGRAPMRAQTMGVYPTVVSFCHSARSHGGAAGCGSCDACCAAGGHGRAAGLCAKHWCVPCMETITSPCKPLILVASVEVKIRSTDSNNWGFNPGVVRGVLLRCSCQLSCADGRAPYDWEQYCSGQGLKIGLHFEARLATRKAPALRRQNFGARRDCLQRTNV